MDDRHEIHVTKDNVRMDQIFLEDLFRQAGLAPRKIEYKRAPILMRRGQKDRKGDYYPHVNFAKKMQMFSISPALTATEEETLFHAWNDATKRPRGKGPSPSKKLWLAKMARFRKLPGPKQGGADYLIYQHPN